MLSWVLTGVVVADHVRTAGWGSYWPLGILPIGLTMLASMALLQRDPERSGLDAFRSGMLALIPSSVLVGWAVVERFDDPSTGHVATASMAGAAVGSVVGALCGPVAGWFVRRLMRSDRRVPARGGRFD